MKKFLLAILIVFVCIVLATGTFFACMLVPTSLGIQQGEMDAAYGTVLADIEGISIANPRYIDIACLAAHDANTCDLEKSDRGDVNTNQTLIKLAPLLKNFTYRFGKTQTASIYQQLMQGVRFLHIKVTYNEEQWYTSHGILSGLLQKHMTDVLKFLDRAESKGEIVGIILQPIYMGNKSFDDLRNYLATITYNDKSIFDYVHYANADPFGFGEGLKLPSLRYNDLTVSGTKAGVVLFERRDQHYEESWDKSIADYKVFFDLDSYTYHPWHEHTDTNLLMDAITDTYNKIISDHKYDNMLRINQTQAAFTTRTFKDFCACTVSKSLLSIASKHNIKVIEREDFDKLLTAMPVVKMDYVTSTVGNFNARINQLIRAHNEKMVKDLIG